MIVLEHNITYDRFDRIETEPMEPYVSSEVFTRHKGENDLITREMKFPPFPIILGIDIKAYRRIIQDGKEYIIRYTFSIFVDDLGKSRYYEDDYVLLNVMEGSLFKVEVTPPIDVDAALERFRRMGYQAAKDLHRTWKEGADSDPESYPVDENGAPDRELFENRLNEELWEFGFHYMEENNYYKKYLDICGQDRVGYAYFDGIYRYTDKHIKW